MDARCGNEPRIPLGLRRHDHVAWDRQRPGQVAEPAPPHGHNVPPLRTATLTLDHGDVLIFATDGIGAAFADSLKLLGRSHDIADRIVADHWNGTDDALVLVIRYLASRR